ncbi:MAG: RNA-binding domain-containing protein [Chloroflexota bacterium]
MTNRRTSNAPNEKGADKKQSESKNSSNSTSRSRNTRGGSNQSRRGGRRTSRSRNYTQDNGRNSNTQQANPTENTESQGNQNKQWYKADLHLHTMASNDYEEPDATYLDWIRRVAEQELDIVAITDHNTVAGIAAIRKEIEWLTMLEKDGRLKKDEAANLEEWRAFAEKTLVLPGFEFTATFGFHILGIFPPETSVRQLEHVLLTLNVPPDKLDIGSTETGASADVLTAYKVIHEAGGLAIAAHANSTHGVAMRDFPFGGQTKIAYTQDPLLDALEVTDLEKKRGYTTARFFNGTKSEYSRRMHCIQGSDAHRLTSSENGKRLGIGERATEFLLAEASFEALKNMLRSNDFRASRPARPKDKPFDPVEDAREEGPGIAMSFHESASQRGGRLTTILTDICAFANTVGGTLFIGASYGKPKIKGLDDPKTIEGEIRAALDERMTPPLQVQFDTLTTQDVKVLRLTTPKGKEQPYCLDEFKFYIRDETDTSQAVRDEIVALVLAVEAEKRSQGGRNRKGQGPNRGAGHDNSGKNNSSNRNDKGSSSGATPVSNKGDKDDAFYLPQIGVEVIDSNKGNGTHSIRDMRNGNIIKNVTRKGSRKLWNYAIQQHEDRAVDFNKIEWKGDIGLVHVDRRAGKVRYDVAIRDNGKVRVFYGVTEDGMEGRWSVFIQDDE